MHFIMFIIIVVWPAIDLPAGFNCVFLLQMKPLGNQTGTCIELFNWHLMYQKWHEQSNA